MTIAIVIERAIDRVHLMRAVHQLMDIPLREVGNAIGSGKPIALFPLWGNDHVEVAERLRKMIALDEVLASFSFYELKDGETFGPKSFKTPVQHVGNLLDSSEGFE